MPHSPVLPQAALVLAERDARGVLTLNLNQPQNFNALSGEMIAALQSQVDAVAKDESIRAVVIAALGKAFCPGYNLKEMAPPDWKTA